MVGGVDAEKAGRIAEVVGWKSACWVGGDAFLNPGFEVVDFVRSC